MKEVSRVLREEGIFAVYDCDWPPSLTWKVEQSYHELIEWAETIIDRHVEAQEKAYKGNKNEHLKHIRESGVFRFSKEIVFHHIEPFTAERYTGLAVSQGGIQTVFKLKQTELNDKIAQFHALVEEHFQGRTLPLCSATACGLALNKARSAFSTFIILMCETSSRLAGTNLIWGHMGNGLHRLESAA